jgi:hypothetical protein
MMYLMVLILNCACWWIYLKTYLNFTQFDFWKKKALFIVMEVARGHELMNIHEIYVHYSTLCVQLYLC